MLVNFIENHLCREKYLCCEKYLCREKCFAVRKSLCREEVFMCREKMKVINALKIGNVRWRIEIFVWPLLATVCGLVPQKVFLNLCC